jgi:hypothetical protein
MPVQVHPCRRQHHLKPEGLVGGDYVRFGSTNRWADCELVEEFRRFTECEVLGEQLMPGIDSEALEFRAASESFAQVCKLGDREFSTLGLVRTTVMDKTNHGILPRLSGGKGLLASEIAKSIGLILRITRTRLARLVVSELVREVVTGPQDPKRRYFGAR